MPVIRWHFCCKFVSLKSKEKDNCLKFMAQVNHMYTHCMVYHGEK